MPGRRPLYRPAFEAIDKFIRETVVLSTQQSELLKISEGFVSERIQKQSQDMVDMATQKNAFMLGATIVDLFGRGQSAFITHPEIPRLGEITGIAYDADKNNYAVAVATTDGPDIWPLLHAQQLAIGAMMSTRNTPPS